MSESLWGVVLGYWVADPKPDNPEKEFCVDALCLVFLLQVINITIDLQMCCEMVDLY